MPPRVIGIDLGTTNCCVATVEDGRARVLPNKAGYPTTPSVIAFTDDGRRLVGQLAVRQQITNPEHTVFASKRLIGRAWGSPQVQHAAGVFPYRLVEGPNGDVRAEIRGRSYTMSELAALLLQEMRVIAEEQLGEPVDRAVVTVPAYFHDKTPRSTALTAEGASGHGPHAVGASGLARDGAAARSGVRR